VQRDLLAGRRASEPPILPDLDQAPWRGVGPYGQGGTGMTGGVPYGRPMAGLAPDRDGLRLDVLPLRVGPFFPRFPTGLVLAATLAGDVIVEAAAEESPFSLLGGSAGPNLAPFVRALAEPVAVRELELARARSHLRWLVDALVAQGLPALAHRTLRLAQQVGPGDGPAVRDLARVLGWTQVLRWPTRGVGRLAPEDAALAGGPVARASGFADDARLADPAYRALGFQPVVFPEGDAAARWRQRLAEAARSLDLAARAGGRHTTPGEWVESPRGRLGRSGTPTTRLLPLLPGLLRGLEWGDAVATLVSLDLDLEEAGLVARVPEVGAGV
ncbi:MAG: NADH-quinone oxidoreductase subunit D-related protein, partial [Chloroflexota bacterium]